MFLNYFNNSKKGSALIIAIIILGAMVFLATYFISFSLTGSKMASSQKDASQTYYLAEAGVQEAIFKLKNDVLWKSAFETLPTALDPNCSSWSIPLYERVGGLFPNGTYQITINNLGCAKAEIVSQAFINVSSIKKSQRVVKVKISKAMGNPISEYGIFTGGASGNVSITLTNPLRLHGGNMLVKNNLDIKTLSKVYVDEKVLSGNQVSVDGSSQLNSISTCSANMCQAECDPTTECPPQDVEMPPIDFDSDGPDSFLSKANISNCSSLRNDGKINCVFTVNEFENVLWDNYPSITFPTGVVVYVQGDVNIRAGQKLTIAGTLLSDRDINLGQDNCWLKYQPPYFRCGASTVTVLRPSDSLPSGLLAKRKFGIGGSFGIGTHSLLVNGLVYSGDQMTVSSVLAPVEIYGGIVTRKIDFSSVWQSFDIYLDSDVIADTLGIASYSPVIIVDHWEEEY
mgnify:CR=1 FL=1